MIDYIRENICDVEEFEVLKSNQFRTVYLINNKLVVMFSANAKLIFNWYMANQSFAPATIFGYDECVCYDYLVPSSDYLKKVHLIDFIKSYRPKLVAISDNEYYEAIEGKYKANCKNIGIDPQVLKRPSKEGLYQLHGNMNLSHSLIFDGKMILLDPRPITGALLIDIMSMYLSNFEIIEMFSLEDISYALNVSLDDVKYYYNLQLVSLINKSKTKDLKLYNDYKNLLCQ